MGTLECGLLSLWVGICVVLTVKASLDSCDVFLPPCESALRSVTVYCPSVFSPSNAFFSLSTSVPAFKRRLTNAQKLDAHFKMSIHLETQLQKRLYVIYTYTVCVCLSIYTHLYISIYVCKYIYICIHIYIHTCLHV